MVLVCGSGSCSCLVCFCVLIDLSQAVIISRIARSLNRSGFIVFIVFVLVSFYSYYYGTSCMLHLCNSWRVRNLHVMVLRINKSLKVAECIVILPQPGCSGPAPTFVPFYSVYSTPCVSSTMPEKTLSCCPEYSSRE